MEGLFTLESSQIAVFKLGTERVGVEHSSSTRRRGIILVSKSENQPLKDVMYFT